MVWLRVVFSTARLLYVTSSLASLRPAPSHRLVAAKAAVEDSLDHEAYLQGLFLPTEVKYLRQTLEVCITLALLAIVSRPASQAAS